MLTLLIEDKRIYIGCNNETEHIVEASKTVTKSAAPKQVKGTKTITAGTLKIFFAHFFFIKSNDKSSKIYAL